MNSVLMAAGGLLIGLYSAQRLIWLAPSRLGWIFYLANVVGEVGPKRLGLKREATEILLVLIGLGLLVLGGLSVGTVALIAVLALGLTLHAQQLERRLLDAVWTRQDQMGASPVNPEATRGLAAGYPSPSFHPELTVNLIGPFVARHPDFSLGRLTKGRVFQIELIVGNHTIIPTQTALRLTVQPPAGLRLTGDAIVLLPALSPGRVHRKSLEFTACQSSGSFQLAFKIEWGHLSWSSRIKGDGILEQAAPIRSAAITRYPGACRSAFAWRGDMDLYDTTTLQTIEGLAVTLGLAARYRMPQSLYLSSRLALDEPEAARWAAHYGIDRGSQNIPRFIAWVREHVELRSSAGYPFESAKPYLLELGNHGHLHYGTDTAGAAENGWTARARMGAGRYPWLGEETGSLAEQRDNALAMRRLSEKLFGYTPRSWAMPDRTRDTYTPAAMEAAGCEVLSDSDVRTRDNVLRQPPPHFAPGTKRAVELTKRYPGDPEHILHYWMNLFWIHRAHRLGIPVIFMCHQHMRLFDHWACARLTEALLRYLLHRFHGDLWINTVYGIGVYWRDVLSEQKLVRCERVDNDSFRISNPTDLEYARLPIDLRFEDGSITTFLVDAPARSDFIVDISGRVRS